MRFPLGILLLPSYGEQSKIDIESKCSQAKDEVRQRLMAQRSSSFERENTLNAELAEARHSIREAVDALAEERKKWVEECAGFAVSLKRL